MTRDELEIITVIAHEVREWAEMYAIDHNFPETLQGLCAIASGEIHSKLKRHDIHTTIRLYEGELLGHCFLRYGDYVIDVTATQFGIKDRIVIEQHHYLPDVEWWLTHQVFNSVEELKKYQRKRRWEDEQVDIQYLTKSRVDCIYDL